MSEATIGDFQEHRRRVRVWDIWVRLFHWSLVACVAISSVTGFVLGAPWIALHVAAGLAAVVLVAARVVWGFLGPTHARFRDFLRPPSVVLSHLRAPGAERHLGHNPAGGLMMLALMAAVLLLAVTGLAGLGGVLRTGPLASLPFGLGDAGLEIHEALAMLLLAMILVHVAAALVESRRAGENLVRSMVTGTKEARAGDDIGQPAKARPALGLLTILLLVAVVALALPRMTPTPAAGPVAQLDATFVEECTACHLAYHPSLLSGGEWRSIMAQLDDHYGEDASLDPETTAQITAWLTSHDATGVQSRPARLFAGTLDTPTGSLTGTRAWRHLHGEVPDARFNQPPVYSKANCAACHLDAETGWFSPFQIRIPKEIAQ